MPEALSRPRTDAGASVPGRRLKLVGHVQGVGFRPFVYRLAAQHGLTGWVRNRSGEVEIQVAGEAAALDRFEQDLLRRAPPLARPRLVSSTGNRDGPFNGFSILESMASAKAQIRIPADLFTCPDCLNELFDPQDRRYRYPFINCTQCGPRYTLICALPYDRPNTTMAEFPLCRDCEAEYRSPSDRRFHAEPVACPVCGPTLTYLANGSQITANEAALSAAVKALQQGLIVAVKGIGGFHLLCDAGNAVAVQRLRQRKPRPSKPLALMVPSPAADPLAALAGRVHLSEPARQALLSAQRPIVLLPVLDHDWLPEAIAPGLNEVGVMLPYSPLHHLLSHDFGKPLVATSANLSGEPVLTETDEVLTRLAHVADACLGHDRPIARPADDPLWRQVDGGLRPLRLGRGIAPLEIELDFELPEPVLAVGGQMKNTVTLAWGRRAVLSPHIGEMANARSQQVFQQTIDDLQSLYEVQASRVICDAHPGYTTSRWAAVQAVPVEKVYHHRAHASAVLAGLDQRQDWLVFTWDGFGMGEDGSLWGGEALLGRAGHWQRVASLRQFHIPGGERVSREGWRCAAALCWQAGRPELLSGTVDALLHHAWQRRVNTISTSSAGRLFDAAAAMIGICRESSYEGQAPMLLEAAGSASAETLACPGQWQEDLWITDWSVLLDMLVDDKRSMGDRAACLHNAMADIVVQQARELRSRYGVEQVALAGGVFQNRHLAERVLAGLRGLGFRTHLSETIPINDAGLSFGQVVEYACR